MKKNFQKKLIADLFMMFDALEKRVDILEAQGKASGQTDEPEHVVMNSFYSKSVEIDLTLPAADIGGLHFNKQEVHAVFEKQEDGWFYAKDILFMSARNNVNDNSQDILAEYLARDEIKTQIADVFFGASPDDIEIGLPQKQQGAKRYSRVPMWYWLTDSSPYHLQSFNSVGVNGEAFSYQATAIGGCAPAFRIGKQRQ